MDHIKERLPKKRLSETASHLITSTRRKKSESNYKSSWRLWASWCNKQQADAFRCDVTKILDYLTFLFEKSYEYRTIGCHRSAISVFYDFLDGKPVGQHPDVCTPVRGVFSSIKLQPIKLLVWTVESVINYVKTKWKNNENLSQKYLTLSL